MPRRGFQLLAQGFLALGFVALSYNNSFASEDEVLRFGTRTFLYNEFLATKITDDSPCDLRLNQYAFCGRNLGWSPYSYDRHGSGKVSSRVTKNADTPHGVVIREHPSFAETPFPVPAPQDQMAYLAEEFGVLNSQVSIVSESKVVIDGASATTFMFAIQHDAVIEYVGASYWAIEGVNFTPPGFQNYTLMTFGARGISAAEFDNLHTQTLQSLRERR